MVNETEQERVRHLLAEALPMLCKSGLNFSSEFSVEALIGITLDKKDVFLVSVKETFKSENEDGDSSAPEKSIDISVKHMSQSDQSPGGTPRRRRKKNSCIQTVYHQAHKIKEIINTIMFGGKLFLNLSIFKLPMIA